MKKKFFLLIIAILSIFVLNICADEKKEENEKKEEKEEKINPIFKDIKEIWIKKDLEKLKKLLDDRIFINLDKYKGKYTKDQSIGILEDYFKKIEILEFKYKIKRMTKTRAVVEYKYKLIFIGTIHKKSLYIYIKQDDDDEKEKKRTWFVYKIDEI